MSAAIIVVALVAAQYFYRDLPGPVTVDKLPDSARRADVVYDQALKLVGWTPNWEPIPSTRQFTTATPGTA